MNNFVRSFFILFLFSSFTLMGQDVKIDAVPESVPGSGDGNMTIRVQNIFAVVGVLANNKTGATC